MTDFGHHGEVLRAYRLRARLSQSQLGRRVGLDGSHVAHIERGDRGVPLAVFTRLYRFFGERFAIDLLDAADDRGRARD